MEKINCPFFLELVNHNNLVPVMNLNSGEKFGTLSLFFEDMCHRWGAKQAITYFMEHIHGVLQYKFHGVLTKEELNRNMGTREPGTYCIRFSLTQKCSLVVSYVSEDKQILSIPMELIVSQQPFKWRSFNPFTNADEYFENVASYLSLITGVAHKPLVCHSESPKNTSQTKEIYSEAKQQMHLHFWVKNFLSIN